MSDKSIEGGAGPALAAHSKDGSAPGKNPASSATGTAHPATATLCAEAHAACEAARTMVREQPLAALAVAAGAGLLIGALLASAPRR